MCRVQAEIAGDEAVYMLHICIYSVYIYNEQCQLVAYIWELKVYMYIYIYMCICTYVYMYFCIYVYMNICIKVYMCICKYVYVYMCIHACIYIYMYIYICIYVNVYMQICTYVSIYLYIYAWNNNIVQNAMRVQFNRWWMLLSPSWINRPWAWSFCPTVQKARTATAATERERETTELLLWIFHGSGAVILEASRWAPTTAGATEGSSPTHHHCSDKERKQT